MRPVTDSFLSALRGAHKMVARARICSPGQVGVSPTGTVVPILAGDVVMDITADINSTLDLTTSYDWPTTATALGTPYGQEVYVERGLVYGNGTTEYVGLGYFRIESVEQDRTPVGSIRITGKDRMSSLQDGRVTAPIQFGANASVQSVIDFLVSDVLPGVSTVYDFPAGTTLLATAHILDQDRLKFLQDLVTSYGRIMYFDYAGRLQVKAAPDPKKAAVYTINHGRGGVLASMKREITRDGVYNAVVATGEAAGEAPPVSGVAFDLNASSPTFYSGGFGKVPKFFSSTFLSTSDQCVSAAASLLLKATGLPYTVSLGTVPNPALEAGDVVTVSYNDRFNAETHIADRITYPLAPDGVMSLDTRKQFL